LWSEATITPSVGVSTLTSPTNLGNWKLDSIVFSKATDDYQQLEFMDWEPYRLEYKLGVIDSGTPEVFSIKPDNVIDVWPTPDSTTTISTEYYRVPTELAADSDISSIPPRFHSMIIARAKIYYGENEDAPEILSGALASFEDLLDKLESDQLPGQKNRRFSKVQDLFNYTVRPE